MALRHFGDWQNDRRLRFLVAGALAALVNWLARFPLDVVMPYAAAVVAATAIGMVGGFLLYRGWVFPGSDRSTTTQVRDFILVNLIGIAMMVATAVVLRTLFLSAGVEDIVASAGAHAAGIGVGAVANFIGHQHITFRKRRPGT